MKVLSPAKINLMLRILGRRKDGYHMLQTYFQLLNWGDAMQFELLDEDSIIITGEFGQLKQSDNLIEKAALLLKPYRNVNKGIHINVNKKIPQGSGLGGGSSNAGTTLRLLNKLWQCNLNLETLLSMALTLGADVPIFVFNKSAMATSIGEQLKEHKIKPQTFVLVFPKVSIDTKDIFNQDSLKRNQQPIDIKKIANKSNWTNACLPVVLNKFKKVNEVYKTTSKFCQTYLSGTGSTLFTSFDTNTQAIDFISKIPNTYETILCNSKINS